MQGGLNTEGLGRINVPVVKGERGVKEGEFSYLNTHVLQKNKICKTVFMYVQGNEEINNC